ncbi:hypothetical protein EDB81DRAFT_883935 [Dactylonectria macrodidyma]|uniref:DUF7730 domain-containing protein n=1 Tax=Dactylonectria macrodidyma TaxID=307937 RepID=A0A9P9EWE3_9HYPO|nr:hypothetical protein EDB81DRAFT_883935 [Dactylonectria macrodidyma]
MEHKFNEVNFQGKSPFFLKLNADIRRLIYIQLFGKFLVHICGTGEPTWNLESRPPGNILGLWHCICPGGRKEIPHYHSPETHEWRFLATNLLFSCKRIYEEGISILYRKNSFLFELSADVIVFNFQAKQYLKHIRNIDLCVDYDDVLYNYTWLPDLRAACIAISQLEKLVLRIRVPEVLATLTNDELERAPEEIAKAFSEAIEWHCAKSVEIILPEILHGQA